MWSIIWCLKLLLVIVTSKRLEETLKEKRKIYQGELDLMLGSDIILTDEELQANNIIMQLKEKTLNESFNNPEKFMLSKHFFDYKSDCKTSKLYKIIQQMPKGAVLHAHDTGLLNPDYLVSLTYAENLYICFEENYSINFMFSKKKPPNKCFSEWQLMWDARYSSDNIEAFDSELRKHFSIVIDNPNEAYPHINAVWSILRNYFVTTAGLLTFKPVWEKYFYESLRALIDDNIMYIEIRSVLPKLYDLDGNKYDSIETAQSYFDVLEKFRKEHPGFFGAKLIYAPLRSVKGNTINEYINIAKKLKIKFPTFFAGFDLVGQEDLGHPLKDFLPALVEASDELDYFFHAGETNWYGSSTDENLIDAVAIGVKRIGHGYALLKHPLVLEHVKQHNIAIEVNVVSNAVLKLVEDVRNHPLATFLAQGLPVVLSSDDPGPWEAEPMSHDFYVTFLAVASRHADMRLLKKLALNSLYYSSAQNKDKMILEFEKRWAKFVKSIINKNNFNTKWSKERKIKVKVYDHSS